MASLPSYSEIVSLLKKGLTLEAQERIMELREKALELQEENLDLREKVVALESVIALEHELLFDGEVYWRTKNEKREGPFCPKCKDVKSLVVHLHRDGPGWWCNECRMHLGPSDSSSPIVSW